MSWMPARAAALGLLLCARPGAAALGDAELDQPRTVTEREWLGLRLQVLGLQLSYPAYRVRLELTEGNEVQFVLWISSPLAEHLQESGRRETRRLLTYHAEGIRTRVEDLLEADFPSLWKAYDEGSDFVGEYMAPGEEVDAPPRRWARWQKGALRWEP